MTPGFGPRVKFFGELLNQFVRCATPFFFLAAGYFFAVSLARGAAPLPHAAKQIRRLAIFALFWSLVYVFLPIKRLLRAPDSGYWSAVLVVVRRAKQMPAALIFNGSEAHLWFLPALGCALALLAIACHFRLERYFALLATGLFLFGLAGGAYEGTPIGIHLGINTRDGPFFSAIFVFTGFLIHALRVQVSARQALALVAFGVLLRILELLWVSGQYGASLNEVDYLLGTYPFGVGIFLWLLNGSRLGEVTWMVNLSRYSAGIYCAHMLFVNLLSARPLMVGNPLWEIARPFLILALTFVFVVTLARIRFLKPVLT